MPNCNAFLETAISRAMDSRRIHQGEATQGGYLEAREEAAAGPGSPFQPHWGSWRRPVALLPPLPMLFPLLPMAELKDMGGWWPPPNNGCVLPQVGGSDPSP